MIEIMFEKGFIKMLFATETFAVGINMPTKTVLFTSFSKFSNSGFRNIYSHEYTQMAGRAGRRGLDNIGYVIHLNNMFEFPDIHTYNSILSGKPQTLKSKLVIEPQLVLKLLSTSVSREYIDKSMNQTQKRDMIDNIKETINVLERENDQIEKSFKTHNVDKNIIKKYIEKSDAMRHIKPKKKRQAERELANIKMSIQSKTFDRDIESYKKLLSNEEEINNKNKTINNIYSENIQDYDIMFKILFDNDFVDNNNCLTQKGVIASKLNELNNMVFSEIITKGYLENMTHREFITFISLFVHFRTDKESYISIENLDLSDNFKDCLNNAKTYMDKYSELLIANNINYPEDEYTLCNCMYDLILRWCDVENETEAITIINECNMRGVFIGEFVKCLLKIVNISNELNSLSKTIANIKLQDLTNNIEEKILKFVATNQSLYV